jgi:hypothetical protein
MFEVAQRWMASVMVLSGALVAVAAAVPAPPSSGSPSADPPSRLIATTGPELKKQPSSIQPTRPNPVSSLQPVEPARSAVPSPKPVPSPIDRPIVIRPQYPKCLHYADTTGLSGAAAVCGCGFVADQASAMYCRPALD